MYAMYDTAATGPAALLEVADALGLEINSEPTNLGRFNSYQKEYCDYASFQIKSLDGSLILDVKEALIGTLLTTERDKPPRNKDISHLSHMTDVVFEELPDARIAIILDVSFAWAFGPFEQRGGADAQPLAWLTSFGWTILGRSDHLTDSSDRETDICILDVEEMTLEDQINTMFRFDFIRSGQEWHPIEMVHPSHEDMNSLKIMEESIVENESTGHYRVALPWIHGRAKAAEILNSVDSYANARARLMKEKRRMLLDPVRKAAVFKQFAQTIADGHAREVDPNKSTEGQVVWYMPSHIVAPPPDKPDKWRVTLDAASQVQGVSLNSQLGGGPDGLNSLVGINLRWREKPVVVTGDITKFFYQIETDDADVSAFRFLFFRDESMEELQELESNVQIFGAKSSPAISAFTLKYHANKIREKYGDEVFYQIVNQMYVDDLISSFDTVEIARECIGKIVEALAEAGMTLCKIRSSHPEVLKDLDPSSLASPPQPQADGRAGELRTEEAKHTETDRTEADRTEANQTETDRTEADRTEANQTETDSTETDHQAGNVENNSAQTDDVDREAAAGDTATAGACVNPTGVKNDIDFDDDWDLQNPNQVDNNKASMKDLIEGTFYNHQFIDATKQFLQPNDITGKVLGVGYCHETDTMFIRGLERANRDIRTLRDMLKFMAAIFDPMGYVCCVILLARLEFRNLVALGYDWDDIIPDNEIKPFLEWKDSLAGLAKITISRWTSDPAYKDAHTDLIVFSDASKHDGWGVVCYIRRAIDADSPAYVRQVYGKSRVVPVTFHDKIVPGQEESPLESMPKLELEAARLAAIIQDMLNRESREKYERTMLFTDSHTVLQWLMSFKKKFRSYEFHRINKIRDLTDVLIQWHYVASAENPADLCSHGFLGTDWEKHNFFYSGPPWLDKPENTWPPHLPKDVLPAKKMVDIAAISAIAPCSPMDLLRPSNGRKMPEEVFDQSVTCAKLRLASRHGSWYCKVRSIARFNRRPKQLLQFLAHKKRGITLTLVDFQNEIIDTKEFSAAEDDLIRAIQFKHFGKEMKLLLEMGIDSPNSHRELRCKTDLANLNPFLDEKINLRMGSRVRDCPTLDYEAKYPRIIPGEDPDIKGLIQYEHEKLVHASINQTFHHLRSKFHVIGGRQVVNNKLKKCFACQRLEKRPSPQKMGELPRERLQYIRPFRTTCADLTGDYRVKIPGSRASHKRYVLLCACMTTRAVWLFSLRDLTTGVLINALTKLANMFPGVETVHSDCGSNFMGAKRENEIATAEWNEAQVNEALVVQGITWTQSPPHAHFFGGVYERLIGSTKKHLRHLFTRDTTDLEVFEVTLSRVSAILNGRPLTYASNNIDDFRCLSPNNFLYPHVITPAWATIAPPIPASGDNLRGTWRDVRRLSNEFEKLWYSDYLPTLRPYAKWRTSVPDLTIGQLVLLPDKNLPRHHWRMARVDKILSEGSHVRRVIVKTADKRSYERHVNSLIPLELDGEEY